MSDHISFRQRLDAVLRTLDVKQVQDFLITEKQWSEDAPEDPEFAMWMMVAGSPTLKDLHAQAREWLVAHGHQDDAIAILGKGQKQQSSSGKRPSERSLAAAKKKWAKRPSSGGGGKYKKQ